MSSITTGFHHTYFHNTFRDVDVNVRNAYGQTPLIKAAYKGHSLGVKKLLEMNANMEIKDGNGDQPIHIAAQKGDFE